MTEIFLAHDSSDRERVRPLRDALAAQGFQVRWDLEPPVGVEWERWVRRRLARCKCVVVLRSAASAHSNRMSHVEAVAKEHGKLILVRLEPRASWAPQAQAQATADGLNLAGWSGDLDHPGWQELCRRIEGKLKASLWVQRLIHDVETERTRWRAQHEASAARCKSLNDELAHERSERGVAQDRIAGLQAQLDADGKARSRLEARIVELEQRLARAEESNAESGQLLRDELRQKDALLSEAQAALIRAEDEAARLKQELAAVEGVHGEHKSRIASHEATIQARDADIARLEAAVAQRDADIAGLTATVVERDGSVTSLTANVAERDSHVAGLKAGIAARDADIAGCKADMAERDSYIVDLVASVTQRDTYIADLRASLTDRRAYMADLEASIAQRDTHIADLKAALAERDTHIASLTASLKALGQRRWGLSAMPFPAALARVTRPVLDRLGSR